MKTIDALQNSGNRLSRRRGSILIPFGLVALLAISPNLRAVIPAPDGGYPGGNTAEGSSALLNLSTGAYNTALGFLSLRSNTEGSFNTATGAGTLLANTGDQNAATGAGALLANTIGEANTANGAFALLNNITGNFNTASGASALFSNITGNFNTASGAGALYSNTAGGDNTANGFEALGNNITGTSNTAIGAFTLVSNTADDNTAAGANALHSNTTGDLNTAVGSSALYANIAGFSNTAVGSNALHDNDGSNNTAIGINALSNNTAGGGNTAIGGAALFNNSTGGGNVALGFAAGSNLTNGSHNVYIGADMNGVSGENDSCYIRSIFGQTSAGGMAVFINSANKLGTTVSSKRFKEKIKPMDKASEALLALTPVTFRYKKEIDPAGRSQFGLVAEDVEKVNPDLVVRDKEGKPYSVRYDQVNAMLLNEFLKEHRKMQKLEAALEAVSERLKLQEARIQKVSAQLEPGKSARQMVNNNRQSRLQLMH
jgi:hypothetical protein